MNKVDYLITGGRVIDPYNHVDEVRDLAVKDGIVVEADHVEAAQTIDIDDDFPFVAIMWYYYSSTGGEDMFNADWKKQALAGLKRAGKEYNRVFDGVIQAMEQLHKDRLAARDLLRIVENYVFRLANKPIVYEKTISDVHMRCQCFDDTLDSLKKDVEEAGNIGSTAGAGALAGAGIAALGPTAAMAVATTFGTASTGAAIGTLSGAAATNAALAWLGGGSLAAGGAGMAGGQLILKLFGPVGWGLSAAALLGGGFLANKKNKEIARKAERKTKEIKSEILRLRELGEKVLDLDDRITREITEGTLETLENLVDEGPSDYLAMTYEEKQQLAVIMNGAEVLSKLIGEKIA